jgi:signal transduction histidine kinase
VVALANHTVLKRRDGVLVPIEDSAAPIWDDRGALVGVVLVFRDVSTERKSLEILRKTEKLATAARLSASVAHEINNPLEAVVNLVYLAKASPEAAPSVVEALDLAEQELDRVAHITRQTLGFYRESKVPELVDIKSLIESVLRIYSNKLKNKNIVVERSFQECPPVFGVTGELKQVMANLISNAADAVDRGGTIRIETWCPEAPQEKTVHVSITDDGPGIAAEYLDRIFEPFFTTKKDVGTALGLWVTKEIVERHGGRIEVDARSDGSSGAAFSILLPCEAAVADGSVAASES